MTQPASPAPFDGEPDTQAREEVDALLGAVPRPLHPDASRTIPVLLAASRSGGITNLRRIAYVLATAQYEAQFGAQLDEAAENGDFERAEPGTPLGDQLGNTQPGDGERFRGRGFVRIRGRSAYAAWSRRLAMPDRTLDGRTVPHFIAKPETLAQTDVAAHALVRGMRDGIFTGFALGSYVNDKKTDYVNARRVVGPPDAARQVAEIASTFAATIESVHARRHQLRMRSLADRRSADGSRDFAREIRDALARLAERGEVLPEPIDVIEWNGEARQGKFVQLDERTCALHLGRGTYIRLDIQRDLNGLTPPEARNMALKRSGDVHPAVRSGDVNFWR